VGVADTFGVGVGEVVKVGAGIKAITGVPSTGGEVGGFEK